MKGRYSRTCCIFTQQNTTQNKKECTIDTCYNMNKAKNSYAEWKKPDKKESYGHDSICIKIQEMQTNVE